MAGNISEGYAYELRVNAMRLSAHENVNFEEIVLVGLCPRYQKYIFIILALLKAQKTYCIYLNLAYNK